MGWVLAHLDVVGCDEARDGLGRVRGRRVRAGRGRTGTRPPDLAANEGRDGLGRVRGSRVRSG